MSGRNRSYFCPIRIHADWLVADILYNIFGDLSQLSTGSKKVSKILTTVDFLLQKYFTI